MDNPNTILTPENSNGHKKIGPIISTLVIVIVLIIAALYVLASHLNNRPDYNGQSLNAPTTTTATNTATNTDQTIQSNPNRSDDVDSLQKDLNSSMNGLAQ